MTGSEDGHRMRAPRAPQVERAASRARVGARAGVTVVGVDGSEASTRALVWALRHAADHGLGVEVLTAWPIDAVMVREAPGHFSEARWHAREVQAAAVAKALAVVGNAPPYDLRVENAGVLEALLGAATSADLLVIGSDGPDASGSGRAARARITERVRRLALGKVVVIGPDTAPGPGSGSGAGTDHRTQDRAAVPHRPAR